MNLASVFVSHYPSPDGVVKMKHALDGKASWTDVELRPAAKSLYKQLLVVMKHVCVVYNIATQMDVVVC